LNGTFQYALDAKDYLHRGYLIENVLRNDALEVVIGILAGCSHRLRPIRVDGVLLVNLLLGVELVPVVGEVGDTARVRLISCYGVGRAGYRVGGLRDAAILGRVIGRGGSLYGASPLRLLAAGDAAPVIVIFP